MYSYLVPSGSMTCLTFPSFVLTATSTVACLCTVGNEFFVMSGLYKSPSLYIYFQTLSELSRFTSFFSTGAEEKNVTKIPYFDLPSSKGSNLD